MRIAWRRRSSPRWINIEPNHDIPFPVLAPTAAGILQSTPPGERMAVAASIYAVNRMEQRKKAMSGRTAAIRAAWRASGESKLALGRLRRMKLVWDLLAVRRLPLQPGFVALVTIGAVAIFYLPEDCLGRPELGINVLVIERGRRTV